MNESSNQEAVSDVVSKKEFELDGDAIVTGLKDTGISEERITNTVYANIDQGVNIKNVILSFNRFGQIEHIFCVSIDQHWSSTSRRQTRPYQVILN